MRGIVTTPLGIAVGALLLLGTVSESEATYMQAVLDDNPVGYWRLNETPPADSASRNFKAAANSGSAGTTSNSGYYDFGLVPGSTYGEAGPRSPEFPGFEADNNAPHYASGAPLDIVFISEQPAYRITGDLTLEGWIRRDSDAVGTDTLVSKYNATTTLRSYVLQVDSTGVLKLTLSPDGTFPSATEVFGTIDVGTDRWAHIAATYSPSGSGNFIRLYVDGELDVEVTTGVPAALHDNAGQAVRIGYHSAASDGIEGFVDEVAIYNTALSSQRILAHYEAATVPEPSSFLLVCTALAAAAGALRIRRLPPQ